ncbi:MAG: hypothetical protein Q9227_007367 [Pyrenula ochraceoflavens]
MASGNVPSGKLHKRIIIGCDGTWMNSDGETQVPSNVTRICRCIRSQATLRESSNADTKIPQIIYYQSGVGSTSDVWNHIIGGATGKGISENIREAYSFICNNYEFGDEIFLLGFSRGAFTVRSIASLIRAIGLLTRTGLVYFYQIFKDWEHQNDVDWAPPDKDQPWPAPRPSVTTPEYRRKLLELEFTRFDIQIKACAVWDTVGALGVPSLGLLPQPLSRDYSFVDSKVEPIVEYAYQALALDEHRRQYKPTVWERPDGQEWPKILKQCWFPGAHSDIGGSYEDADLSNITLAWMISQLDRFVDFDHSYVRQQYRLSEEAHARHGGRQARPWGCGYIHNSMRGLFWLGGSSVRTPADYSEIDRRTLQPKIPRQRLKNTNESVHASVRVRMGMKGLGYNDKGYYDSQALKGWKMEGTLSTDRSRPRISVEDMVPPGVPKPTLERLTDVCWRYETGENENPELTMPEDELGDLEMEILRDWHKNVWDRLPTLGPGGHASTMKKAESFPIEITGSGSDSTEVRNQSSSRSRDRPDSKRSNTSPRL